MVVSILVDSAAAALDMAAAASEAAEAASVVSEVPAEVAVASVAAEDASVVVDCSVDYADTTDAESCEDCLVATEAADASVEEEPDSTVGSLEVSTEALHLILVPVLLVQLAVSAADIVAV